jgi:hypothetical protein
VLGGKNVDLDKPHGCRFFLRKTKQISGHLDSSTDSITRKIAMHKRACKWKITTVPSGSELIMGDLQKFWKDFGESQ